MSAHIKRTNVDFSSFLVLFLFVLKCATFECMFLLVCSIMGVADINKKRYSVYEQAH